MRVVFNGRHSITTGSQPKKPVPWTGTVVVSSPNGDAMTAPWSSSKGQPLTYGEAKDAIWQATRDAQLAFALQYQCAPEYVTFNMLSR